ncbi:hypothetical protein BREVNS_1420 [Brevinematales bacterium NS]|nr:hypothetical protein BREVNS_1420 [Brevinematales bacterium NS]
MFNYGVKEADLKYVIYWVLRPMVEHALRRGSLFFESEH